MNTYAMELQNLGSWNPQDSWWCSETVFSICPIQEQHQGQEWCWSRWSWTCGSWETTPWKIQQGQEETSVLMSRKQSVRAQLLRKLQLCQMKILPSPGFTPKLKAEYIESMVVSEGGWQEPSSWSLESIFAEEKNFVYCQCAWTSSQAFYWKRLWSQPLGQLNLFCMLLLA